MVAVTVLETVSNAEMERRASIPMLSSEDFMVSGSASGYCVNDIVAVFSRAGATMPDLSTTAIFFASSFAIVIMSVGRVQSTTKRSGTRKVVIMNDFFFTRVRYSRLMMIFTVCRFILLSSNDYSPSVTSLMKMSFILGRSSLNELTVKPFPRTDEST